MAPGNPLGAQVVYDGENPRIITGTAREVISGGDLVFVSGATGVVGSDSSSFNAVADITFALSADDQRFNGIAITSAGSNGTLSVATRGSWLLKCGGSVFGGAVVETIGDEVAVQTLSSGGVPAGLHTNIMAAKGIGRSFTDGASGGYALIDINP